MSTATNTDKERADFEKLAEYLGYSLDKDYYSSEYRDLRTIEALCLYRAGRAAERAKKKNCPHPLPCVDNNGCMHPETCLAADDLRANLAERAKVADRHVATIYEQSERVIRVSLNELGLRLLHGDKLYARPPKSDLLKRGGE